MDTWPTCACEFWGWQQRQGKHIEPSPSRARELIGLQQWLFDSPTAPPRLLKFRSGHHAPPHLIRYYGDDGKQLLTASRDRSLRCTSVVRDSRSFELSQGVFTLRTYAFDNQQALSRISDEESNLSLDTHCQPKIPSCHHSLFLLRTIKRLGRRGHRAHGRILRSNVVRPKQKARPMDFRNSR